MPVRPAQKRIDKWTAKMQGEAISVVAMRQKEYMLQQVIVRFPEIVDVENATQLILAEAATSVLMNPSYLNFGRECYSLRRKFSGGQLLNRVNVSMNKWVARGLDMDILEKIRATVFTLAPPAP